MLGLFTVALAALVSFLRSAHVGLTHRTGVLALKPLHDALFMESMKTGHNYEFIADFIVALTDRAHLVFLAEI